MGDRRGLIVDNFAGGGGASTGIARAFGRSPDYAINHDAIALAMHAANHPETKHLCENVWAIDPNVLCAGRQVDFAWFSPDCKHFSRAKGAKPVAGSIRALAWVVIRWARAVNPPWIIMLENVPEFETWGPLDDAGRPRADKLGRTFSVWLGKLRAAGYTVEWRTLRASDYGAPTSRKRLFLIARRDGLPIVWPAPTHGPGLLPVRTAASCIDWSIPVPSIFDRPKPLVEATLRRIARGIRKFVLESARPFVVRYYGTSTGHGIDEPLRTIAAQGIHEGLVVPSLVHLSNGERVGQAPRIYDVQEPLSTIVAGGVKHGLATAFLAKHFGGHTTPGGQLDLPLSTITAQDHHALVEVRTGGRSRAPQVRAFLTQYNGQSVGQPLQLPLGAATTKERFGLVTVHGEDYEIVDIGMRMLVPRELFRGQGFPDSYVIDRVGKRKKLTKTAQVRLCGNSVCPDLAEVLARANAPASMLSSGARTA